MSYDEHLISMAGGDGDYKHFEGDDCSTPETFADRMARKSIEAKKAKHEATK
jgi:hypothetical protein